MLFLFDLDGTLTTQEILPLLGRQLGLERQLAALTRLTLAGTLPFEQSFRQRFALLRHIPLCQVHAVVKQVALAQSLLQFIQENKGACAVVTGNLDCWVAPLIHTLGCAAYTSLSCQTDGQLSLARVLHKGSVAAHLKKSGKTIVAVGESYNDVPMFQHAHSGIAFAGVHTPHPALIPLSRYTARSADDLYTYLQRLKKSHAHGTQ